jgi:hypothetical protein
MKTFLSLIVLIVLAAGGAYFGSPYYTIWRLEQAAKGLDAATIGGLVDFPAVRANLSPKLASALAVQMNVEQAKPHSIFDRIGMAIAPLLHHRPGETLVTAQGVAVMLKTAKPPSYTSPLGTDRDADAAHPGQPYTVSEGYFDNDFDQFHAAVGNRLGPDAVVRLRLLRRGFFTWKVMMIDLGTVATTSADSTPNASD